jgi:extradiol dioxygenase family protein
MFAFHLAFPMRDMAETRHFYTQILGCTVGREAERWIDFDFFGHQISAHMAEDEGEVETNDVEGVQVPSRHFGLVLDGAAWDALAERCQQAGVRFLVTPRTRFRGKIGEQRTFFILDPAGNALEFKHFPDPTHVFKRTPEMGPA